MNDLMDFLTSQEALVVYIIATALCLVCMIIYFVEKNNIKRKQKHNTKELNKLVEKVKKEMNIKSESIEEYSEPVIETVEEVVNSHSVEELLDNTKELKPVTIEEPTTLEIKEEEKEDLVIEELDLIEEVEEDKDLEVVRINKEDADIKYTTIEPDEETAKLELNKLKEELEKEEKENLKKDIVDNNIKLTSFEEEQESTAIISLEELIKKSKEMYEKNELTQYMEENTAPISLEELARQAGVTQTKHEEPFIIDQVVLEERVEEQEPKEEVKEVVQMQMDDFKTVKSSEVKKFKSSPIISPIYGIEKTNDLELENTANYEKLDKEIQKSNEFLMSLKDLQEKLKG